MADRDDPTSSWSHTESERDVDTRFAHRNLGGAWWLALLLVPLLLAALLTGLRGSTIEDALKDRSQAALSAAGLDGVNLDFDGRDATLSGAGLSAADLEKARGIVGAVDGVRVADVDTSGVSGTPTDGATDAPSDTTTTADAMACEPATVQSAIDAEIGDDMVTFGEAKVVPDAASQSELAEVAALLAECTDLTITVTGHTDAGWPTAKQMTKSKERAEAVVTILTDAGVQATFAAEGVGSTEPLGEMDTQAGKDRQRFAGITVS